MYLQNVRKAGLRILPHAPHGSRWNDYEILSNHVNRVYKVEFRILLLFPPEIMDVLISNIPFQMRFNLKSHLKLWYTSMTLLFEGRFISLRPAWTTKQGARSK